MALEHSPDSLDNDKLFQGLYLSLCEVYVSRRVCVSYCKDQHLNQGSAKCSPGVIAPPTMFEMKHNHIYSFKYYLCLLSYYRVEWL